MKRMLIAVFISLFFIVNPAAAGMPVSVKADLSRIIIPVKHAGGDLFDLVMENGVAWWLSDEQKPMGFFTYSALKKVWGEKGLKLQKPIRENHCFPGGGLEKGLFLVSWDEQTKEGTAIPVLFSPFGVGLENSKGERWHRGDIWIPQEPAQWLVNGNMIFWEP